MSDVVYKPVFGFVQFDPREREVAGKNIRDLTLVSMTTGGNVGVTLWPEHEAVSVGKGDLVFAEGKYTVRTVPQEDGTERVYHNVSAARLTVIPQAATTTVARPAVANRVTPEAEGLI